jgi:hypothetical protein
MSPGGTCRRGVNKKETLPGGAARDAGNASTAASKGEAAAAQSAPIRFETYFDNLFTAG